MHRYGKSLRAKCKYAQVAAVLTARMLMEIPERGMLHLVWNALVVFHPILGVFYRGLIRKNYSAHDR